jgi:linoleoyl-CoA desaturase
VHDRDLLSALRAELRDHGYFERPTARQLTQFTVHLAIAVGAAALAIAAETWWLRAGAVFLSSVGTLGAGMTTHSASHFALARQRRVNEALTFLGFPVLLGLSATWWWHKHVAVHHPAPNVVGIDGDADLAPWFALTEEQARDGGPLRRFYYRHLQWLLFPIVLGITGFRMQGFGWQHVVRAIRGGGPRSRKAGIDLAALLAHYGLWLGLPMLMFPAGDVLVVYVARIICMGYGMFAVLGPGHFPIDASAVAAGHHKSDYVLLQTSSTVNFRTGVIGRMVCAGLEYQIEHHLFPDISHPHYPRVARHVEAFCRAHGYPYRTYGWTRAIWEALRVFYKPKPVHHEMGALRVSRQAAE